MDEVELRKQWEREAAEKNADLETELKKKWEAERDLMDVREAVGEVRGDLARALERLARVEGALSGVGIQQQPATNVDVRLGDTTTTKAGRDAVDR